MTIWEFETMDWDPWRDLSRMRRRVNRLLGELSGTALGGTFPPLNVSTTGEKAVVTAAVPGINPDELDISVENDVLTIRGSREPEKLQEGERYRRHERDHGPFTRSLSLPFAVDADRVEASYSNGLLSIELPRSEESRPRRIEIKG